LTVSSNLVGKLTGKSAGFSPSNICQRTVQSRSGIARSRRGSGRPLWGLLDMTSEGRGNFSQGGLRLNMGPVWQGELKRLFAL
jgi:hypothetical protein